ncbi:MAG: HAD family hydrolase [archaeon]
MIKAVVFDLWNTLVSDSLDFPKLISLLKQEHLSRKEFIEKYEKSVQLKRYKSFSEMHLDYLRAFNRTPSELAEKMLHEIYFKRANRIKIFSDVEDALSSLKIMNLKLALLSNTENIITDKIAKETNLFAHFDALCLSCDIGALKPSKKAYFCVLSKLKVKPSEVLMVGDSLRADIGGSKKAGLHNCLINRSGRILDYADVVPEFEIKSLKKVARVVGELNERKK